LLLKELAKSDSLRWETVTAAPIGNNAFSFNVFIPVTSGITEGTIASSFLQDVDINTEKPNKKSKLFELVGRQNVFSIMYL
jgi:hypothetical protein